MDELSDWLAGHGALATDESKRHLLSTILAMHKKQVEGVDVVEALNSLTDEAIINLINLITDLADADALDRAIPAVRAALAATPSNSPTDRR